MSLVTVPAPPPAIERWKSLFLAEVARLPAAAATVWGITLAGCFGALWSERFPLNSGEYFAWSLHTHFSSRPLFSPLTAVVFVTVLLVAVAVAWALTALAARDGRISFRAAAAGALILPVLALLPPAILSEDTASYWAYGRIGTVYGQNPFVASPLSIAADPSFEPVATVWEDMPSTYGPGFVWVAQGVAAVSGTSFATAVLLFKLIALMGVLFVSLMLIAATRDLSPEERAFRLVLWGWNPIVTLYMVGGGHNDAMVTVGLALASLGIIDGRHRLAFGGILIAALMKPIALVAAPVYAVWLWSRSSHRPLAVKGGLACIAGVALAYAPYWDGGQAIAPLRRIAWRIEDALPVGFIASPTSYLLDQSGMHLFARLLSMATVGVIALWLLRRLGRLDPLEVIALSFGAILLASTYTQPWYLAWALVPLCFAGRRALERWARPMTLLCAIWAVKAVRNQFRFRPPGDLSSQIEDVIHKVQGLLTLVLVICIIQTLRRPAEVDGVFPELDDLRDAEPSEADERSIATAAAAG